MMQRMAQIVELRSGWQSRRYHVLLLAAATTLQPFGFARFTHASSAAELIINAPANVECGPKLLGETRPARCQRLLEPEKLEN